MVRKLQMFSRDRPRVLTLLALVVVVAVIAFANLSSEDAVEESWSLNFTHKSYGWPLIWHRFVVLGNGIYYLRTVGWRLDIGRLALNLLLWLGLLATTGLVCESLLRRCRPKPRWSLRTMLALVAIAAAFFAWLAAALDRAEVQDQILASVPDSGHTVHVERWGPRWLDLFGVDRLRRYIVQADVCVMDEREPPDQLFRQLARLQKLRWLSFHVTHFTPDMAASLNEMRGLQRLQITHRSYGQSGDEILAWRGAVPWQRDSRIPPFASIPLWPFS